MHSESILFLIFCASLVLFMTPGLAFFYGGLVRASTVVNMMMMSFGAIAIGGVVWAIFGYAVVFSNAGFGNYLGFDGFLGIDLNNIFLNNLVEQARNGDGLPLISAAFQGTFAIITVALISGAIADRAKFGSWMIFVFVWLTIVYFPIASWVFNFSADTSGNVIDGGWLVFDVGLKDFAGGTVVEIASGASALALALVIGKRFGFSRNLHVPHNVPLVLIGTGILWFGWLGFNAGSEIIADGTAALSFINTIIAPVGAMLSWMFFEKMKHGKPTSIGAASGIIAGAVAITPSCAYVQPIWAVVLGLITGLICALAIELKFIFNFDDSLDVVGIHLVGGVVGTLFIAFASSSTGLFFGHGFQQLGAQLTGIFTVAIYAFGMTFLIGKFIQRWFGFRIEIREELSGIDITQHGFTGYGDSDPRWFWAP
ncbi:MAG: ammonium transporter [Rhodoluna sp.]